MRTAVGFAALILIAGCLGGLGPTTDTKRTAPAASAGGGDVRTAPDGTPADGNPWGDGPIVVGVRPADRAYVDTVRNATAYWERADEQYLGFPVEYEVRPDAADPDVVVAFVAELPACEGTADAAGCAPLVRGQVDDRPAVAYVRTGFARASRLLVTKHELGHTLGLTHADRPEDVMAAASVLYTRPRPNATDRTLPWPDAEFVVAVNASGADDPAGARRQVAHALDYYGRAPPGVPANVTFVRASETDAPPEVTVQVGGDGCAGSGPGSCIHTQGTDPDGDGAIETYTGITVVVEGVETAAVGWHTGYWLAHGLGMEEDAEKPPPFRSATYEERRSRWWE